MRILLIAAAIIAAPITAAPALGQDADSASRGVRFSDLDLKTNAGQRALRARIGRAVTYVCGTYPVGAQPEEVDRLNACRKAAMADANQQLASRRGNAVLASAYPR